MKKILFISTLTTLFITANAQTFGWAKSIGGQNYDDSRAIAVDKLGNVYTVGYYQKYVGTSIDFDPGPGTFTLDVNSQYDGFVSKLDANGNFVWAKNIGSFVKGNSISIDSLNNVFIVGSFIGTSDFDPSVATYTMNAPDISGTAFNPNIFILKLNSNGNFIWAKNIGNQFTDIANNISIRGANVYVTGSYNGSLIDFDPNTGTQLLSGYEDAFMLKLDTAGNFIWAKNVGGTSIEVGNSVTSDIAGNIYATGTYGSNSDFDPSASTYTIAGQGAFILKLDASGNFLMAKGLDGATGKSIRVDATGNIYTAGNFQGIVDLDPSLTTYTYQSIGGGADLYVSKLNSTGSFVWAKNINSSSADLSAGLELDAVGNIYLTAKSYGSGLKIEGGPINIVPGFAGDYMVILQFNNLGSLIGINSVGGSDVMPKAMALDASNTIYTTGYFVYTCDFNPDVPVVNLVSLGFTDNFISKLTLNPFIISGISEYKSVTNLFNAYPNPSNELINIKLEILSETNTTIEITNTLGQVVLSKALTQNITQLNISDLTKGIYFITVKTGDKTSTQKLVIN